MCYAGTGSGTSDGGFVESTGTTIKGAPSGSATGASTGTAIPGSIGTVRQVTGIQAG